MARFLLVFGIPECFWIGCYGTIYDNHTLIKFFTSTEEQLLSASRFRDPNGEVDVLKVSRGINDTLDLLVPPERLQYVDGFAKFYGLPISTKQDNYGRNVIACGATLAGSFRSLQYGERNVGWSVCHARERALLGVTGQSLAQSDILITEFMEMLAARHPDVLQLQTVGNSYEGRPIKLARISSNLDAGNPVIFIDAGVHSREWVAPAMAVYLIDRLVSDPNSRQAGEALDGVDWLILPVVNPDGYEFSRSKARNRLWRKTRSKHSYNSLAKCIGVDGNRNYDFQWGVSGSSDDPCDAETYCGPRPFSEPETQIVRNIMLDNKSRIKLYVSLHSYGQYLVYPWGYTGERLPKTWKKLDQLARSVSKAVQEAEGNFFRVMSAGKWYPASGASDDYAFGVANIPYSYTMELTLGHEFIFPERLLSVVLPQFFEGFNIFAFQIRNEFALDKE